MENIPKYIAIRYDDEVGKDIVEKVAFRQVKNIGRLYINKTNYFEPMWKEVFDFYIGGYKILDKYLKGHKGKNLEIEELQQVKDIVNIIAFTIE